ncbi:MAG TPA: hypothetical protein VM096_04085 [Vicinamibacterales bacterium]|nr:hypothetical protein [Vicinamibacterales bacterium]
MTRIRQGSGAAGVMGALGGGLLRVLASPLLIAAAIVAMLLITVPFAFVVGSQLQGALSNQPPINRDAGEIDPEWWFEFRQHAGGLASTFTPSIIGFAAPLSNLSALLDGAETASPLLLLPYLLAIVVWSFLWGAALERFAHGATRFGLFRAGARTFIRFLVISMIATAVLVLLYASIHPVLFRVLAPRLEMSATTERTAFVLRGVVYLLFGTVLVILSVIADYARVAIVMGSAGSAIGALREGWRFVRGNFGSTVALYVLTGLFFVALLVVYGYVDVYGGSRVTGWLGIAIAQAYIVARLVIRLTFGASEVRLYRELAAGRVG